MEMWPPVDAGLDVAGRMHSWVQASPVPASAGRALVWDEHPDPTGMEPSWGWEKELCAQTA